MVEKKRVVVAGSRGVFGTHLLRELGDRYDVLATTRDTLDLNDVDAVARSARGTFAFACAAGPFQKLDRGIVRAVVDAGAHWLDIADDERWFFDLVDDRQLDALARERGVVVMPGLSTLPAISCALVRRVLPAERVKITLFIGNDNPKGAAAIASGSSLKTPDVELLRREGIEAEVVTRFEMLGAKTMMRVLSMLPLRARVRLAKLVGSHVPRSGTSGGYVEVRAGDRVARFDGGQNMAVLPLVYVLDHIDALDRGVHPPTVLDGEELLLECGGRAAAFSMR